LKLTRTNSRINDHGTHRLGLVAEFLFLWFFALKRTSFAHAACGQKGEKCSSLIRSSYVQNDGIFFAFLEKYILTPVVRMLYCRAV
jgi:hypothetical protein